MGEPKATREIAYVPIAPLAKVHVKVRKSSFSTGSTSSETSACAWPTTLPTGRGRSLWTVSMNAPRTAVMGPLRNSPVSITCEPRSPSAPEPGEPL